jgi:Outer membrane protein beta-barrel domain
MITMKKKILLSFSLLVSIVAFAQQPVSYGVSAGAGIYNMRGETVNELKQVLNFTDGIITTHAVTGFNGGGYVNIPVGGNLSVEPGLYYSAKGYQLKGSYTVKDISILSANAVSTLRTGYIDMPVLLKADFNGLQVFAGPQVSYLTGASLNTRASVAFFDLLNSDMDITSRFNRWDAAVTGGVGYQFSNGLRLTAAYERGLMKADAERNTQLYNQGIKIGAGFTF